MNNDVVLIGQRLTQPRQVADIQPIQRITLVFQMLRDVAFLDGRIIKRIEVVDDGDPPTFPQQAVDEMAADKPSAPGHQRVASPHFAAHAPITADAGRRSASTWLTGRPMPKYVNPAL